MANLIAGGEWLKKTAAEEANAEQIALELETLAER